MSFEHIQFDISQEDWGYTHPHAFVRHTPTVVELHHTVMPAALYSPITHAQVIHNYHMGKGWNGVFYNVGVDSITGQIVELRGVGNQSTGLAKDALTVVLFGNHHSYDGHPTPDIISDAAMKSLLEIAALAPNPDGLRGHRERPYATACPGSYAMDNFVLPYRRGEFDNVVVAPKPPPPPFKDDEMPYAIGKHKDNASTFALFESGIVRSLGPAEYKFLTSKGISVVVTSEDSELDRWRAAAKLQQ